MPVFDPAALRDAVKAKLAESREAPEAAPDPEKKEGGIGVGPYAALIGGSAADLGTTMQALKRPGTYEANPLLSGGTAEMMAVKGGSTLALAWAMHELAKTHPKAAKMLGYGGGAALGGLALHNMKQGK